MHITSAFSFLVHPSKNADEQPEVGGAQLPLSGKLYDMLFKVFTHADEECMIDIMLLSDGAVQANERRDEILALLQDCTIDRARVLAKRLQKVTTHRSGLGLLFVVVGEQGPTRRIYLTRFPADFGIVAKEEQSTFTVEFIEEVFLRNALSYKAVVFDGQNLHSDFWVGKAVDRQVSQGAIAISRYWIHDFLLGDFRTTPAAGTRRLALAIQKTMDSAADVEIKEELAAASRLAKSLGGVVIDMENFADRFGLSATTRDAMVATMDNPGCRFDQFEFSPDEFAKHLKFRSIQVSSGATITARIDDFDRCIERTRVAAGSEEYVFSTTGTVVDEKLRKTS